MELKFDIIYKSQLQEHAHWAYDAPVRIQKTFIFFDGDFYECKLGNKCRYVFDPTEHKPKNFFKQAYAFAIKINCGSPRAEGIWIVTNNHLTAIRFNWMHKETLVQKNPIKFLIGSLVIAITTVIVQRLSDKLLPVQDTNKKDTIIIAQPPVKSNQAKNDLDTISKGKANAKDSLSINRK